jgi:hypothetical protein
MTTIALDTIDKLEITPTDYFNEFRTLQTLMGGLHRLYSMIKRRELEFERRCGCIKMTVHSFGMDFDGTRDHLDTIACFFHWFGVSVCNYARLVGFIHGLERKHFARADLTSKTNFKTIKAAVDAYADSVTELKNVQIWRNKVAAHFAITDPYKDDNIATLDMSVVFPVTFEGRYVVGGLTMIRGNSMTSHTSQIPPWSLTEVFESLVPRFWTDCPIPTVEQLQDAIMAQSGHGANI